MQSRQPAHRGGRLRPPGWPVPDLLARSGLILALTGAAVLTVQAYLADDARREASTRGLQHLARIAAWEFARQSASLIGHGARMALWTATGAAPEAMDHATHAATHCDGCAPPLVGPARFTAMGGSGTMRFTNPPLVDVPLDQVMAVAERSARRFPLRRGDETVVATVRDASGRQRVVATGPHPASAGRQVSVLGVVAPAEWLDEVFSQVARNEVLPPVLLGDEAARDGGLAVTVRTPGGALVFRSPSTVAADPGVSGTAWLVLDDSLVVDVTLAPSTAAALAHLVPHTRPVLPLLVFALTAVVLGLATAQHRRSLALAHHRADFLASVSHDLNAPLALLTVYAETLLAPGRVGAGEREAFTGVILREARRLSRLVDNALRCAEGATPPRLRADPIDVADLLRDAVADFRPLAEARGTTLSLTLEGTVTATVVADRDACRQILFNLLDNAAKYGPRAQVVALQVSEAQDGVEVTIDDQGPGIPARDRRRVFDRFVRLGSVERGAPAGSGIGLAVVRDLCQRMQIALEVADAPSGGTRVILRFVRASPHARPAGAASGNRHATAIAD